ncbi:ribonuclease III [Candidatus Symbiobacter mobilis]|uniref:ribonuclease III n=1 Tax=Candidatus Symbiobacter mobilis TaxID=1436290 RepID=UPI00059C30D9|nr:ribonuclease III [Candidatus Symbiobacter mobilis]
MDRGALSALQDRLRYQFRSPALLERALTHRSFGADHNERLEFLGDAVLALAVSDALFAKRTDLPEGDLSRIRAHLVRQDTLFHAAQALGLPALLRLGECEVRAQGSQRPSILADALEAMLGAVYLDGGYLAAKSVVERIYAEAQIDPTPAAIDKDPKTRLQEWLQARKRATPVYEVAATHGAPHQQTFQVACHVPSLGLSAQGVGASRRAAEQAAAEAMLQKLCAAPATHPQTL